MKIALYIIFALAALLMSVPAQEIKPSPSPETNKKTILDIKKQIDATPQKRNLMVGYDQNNNRSMVRTNRLVLGRQRLLPDPDADDRILVSSIPNASIPTWEFFVTSVFETQYLNQTPAEYAWKFNVYVSHGTFPLDAELKIKLDNEEMTFKPVKSGRSLTSDLTLSGGDFQKDKTTDSVRDNAGNISQIAKPAFLIFILTRADMEKIAKAPKANISLSKQLVVTLQKEYKEAVSTLVNVTTVQ
jgi:hypothetical protein